MSLKFAWGGYFEAVNSEKNLTIKELLELDDVFQVLVDLENFASLEEISTYKETISQISINKLNSPLLDAVFVFLLGQHSSDCFNVDVPELINFISTKREYDLNIVCDTRKNLNRKKIVYRSYDYLAHLATQKNCSKILDLLIGKYEARIYSHGDSCCDGGFSLLRDATEKSFTGCIKVLLKYYETYEDYDRYMLYSAATEIKNIDIAKIFLQSKLFDSECFQALLENVNMAMYVLENFSKKISLDAYKSCCTFPYRYSRKFLNFLLEKCKKVHGVDLKPYIEEELHPTVEELE